MYRLLARECDLVGCLACDVFVAFSASRAGFGKHRGADA
jgi:hypothetical protein